MFGFIKDINLNDDLFVLTKNIKDVTRHNKTPLLIIINLAIGFETVDSKFLICKLKLISIQGVDLNMFKTTTMFC